MGRDKGKKPLQLICLAFQSTLPAWGETRYRCRFWQLAKYFNPLSPHGERLGAGGVAQNNAFISIHSPRMGRDLVYIHYIITAFRFQSTLPAWGETEMLMQRHIAEYISIHSPRMGRDSISPSAGRAAEDFNPLSPHGERRSCTRMHGGTSYFNPLSPHGERQCISVHYIITNNFNPLSPHGERHPS